MAYSDKLRVVTVLKTRCGCSRVLSEDSKYPPVPSIHVPMMANISIAESDWNKAMEIRIFNLYNTKYTNDHQTLFAEYLEK